LSNIRVQLDDDGTAVCRSYVYAYHRRTGGQDVHLWGRYHDRVVRDGDRWLISHRRLLAAAERGVDPDPGHDTRYALMPRRGRSDARPPRSD